MYIFNKLKYVLSDIVSFFPVALGFHYTLLFIRNPFIRNQYSFFLKLRNRVLKLSVHKKLARNEFVRNCIEQILKKIIQCIFFSAFKEDVFPVRRSLKLRN